MVLSWNCNGLGNTFTVRRLTEIHHAISPDIMFLMETKNSDDFIANKFLWMGYSNKFTVPPTGMGGGLALLWKEDLNITILSSSKNFIDVELSYRGVRSFITFVYGSPQRENRAAFWTHLSTLGADRELPWLLTGDFNEILENAEKVGGPPRWEGSFLNFRSFVSQHGLWDQKHSGCPLSWRGMRHTHFVQSRLDRALSNYAWSEAYPVGRCRYLRFEGSDHRHVAIYFNVLKHKSRSPFRFDRRLIEKPEIAELIKDAWNLCEDASIIAKLNLCRRRIIDCAKEQQRNSCEKIKATHEELEWELSDPNPNQPVITLLYATLDLAYKEEESFWRQRSRIQWLQGGDRNSSYFHAVTRGRRKMNAFTVIEDESGTAFFEEEHMAKVISEYFQNIFTSNLSEDFSLVEEVLQPKLTSEMNEFLIAIPDDKEIKAAAFSISAHKAPGPDGFSASFYHAYWRIIGADLSRDIRCFFESNSLHIRQNETHIRLIPKGVSPRRVGDYRPIALCTTHYKIIAKILTKRLQPLLPLLISKHQSAFVPHRAISDNVLITHETLHFLRTSEAKKFCSMAVKTDMSKAYDRIEWGFLKAVLTRFGFHENWIAWIMTCVKTVSYSFLLNGAPQGKVIPSRGLRQGDPLSPYLFILCTEVLSDLCTKAQVNGSLPGIRVARASPLVNHLLFADDTMFFC